MFISLIFFWLIRLLTTLYERTNQTAKADELLLMSVPLGLMTWSEIGELMNASVNVSTVTKYRCDFPHSAALG